MEELIAKRYAKALSSVSRDLSAVSKVLDVLTEAMADEEVMAALSSPIVASAKKIEMLLAALGEGVDEALKNFIRILGENKRLDLIPAIAKVLNAELQQASNQYEGVVKSNQPLDEGDLSRLEKTLLEYTGSKIKLKHEKSELEGLRVSVDDLGIEVNFSKQRVKEQLIDFIKKSL